MNSIVFHQIEKDNIFQDDFKNFLRNNELNFNKKNNIVIYAPNGSGKSSFCKVLAGEGNTKLKYQFDNDSIKEEAEDFFCISDQNGRNLIEGKEKEFLLGDNLRNEYELRITLNKIKESICKDVAEYAKDIGIKNKSAKIFGNTEYGLYNNAFANFIKSCVNSKDKGSSFTHNQLIDLYNSLNDIEITAFPPEDQINQIKDVISDIESDLPIYDKIRKLTKMAIPESYLYRAIDQNSLAIKVLNEYDTEVCIVCDNREYNRKELCKRKNEERKLALKAVTKSAKEIIELLLGHKVEDDAFQSVSILKKVLNNNNLDALIELQQKLELAVNAIPIYLKNLFVDKIQKSDYLTNFNKYIEQINNKIVINDNDLALIQDIVNNNMNKALVLNRDENNNIRILLNGNTLLGKDRTLLPLSSGEQNFISLAFELIRAKHVNQPVIVVDDPLSSFDSIYKNKIVYLLLKILSESKKHVIILTHNMELLHLLEVQQSNRFELYLLNNSLDQVNGFIHIVKQEVDMLTSLYNLISTFSNEIFESVNNTKLFFMGMVPFMRSYAHLIKLDIVADISTIDIYNSLSNLMHADRNESVDVSKIFGILFNPKNTLDDECIKANDYLNVKVEDLYSAEIIDVTKYPLLNRTLRHNIIYLHLRMLVEYELTKIFNLQSKDFKTLGEIIETALPRGNNSLLKYRVSLLSKKTLLNEFNHFEGNLSIYQPAIDITDSILKSEVNEINQVLTEIKIAQSHY